MITPSLEKPCPCGSGADYSGCCQPLHKGAAAPTPQALMRSRYCAFVLNLSDYLRATWHHSTRPESLSLESSPDWASLQILNQTQNDTTGSVHFRAVYRLADGWGFLEEKSDFVLENGRWYYLKGNPREGQLKPGRNDACPCGSGRKFKACCR